MSDEDRVVTAKLPADLVGQLDLWAKRIDRSKSWIVRQALGEWLAETQRRYQLTLEGLADIDAGRMHSHEEVLEHFAERRRRREGEGPDSGA